MTQLRNLRRLSCSEIMILGQAWVLFLVVSFGLRLMSFRSLLRLFQKPRHTDSVLPPDAIARLVWLVEAAGRRSFTKPRCLQQALVLSWLLGRRGLRPHLRIGISRQSGRLSAHAWLEQDGRVILGHQLHERYLPLFEA